MEETDSLTNFARTLERELAELRMDYEGQRASEEASVAMANELRAERDTLRARCLELEKLVNAKGSPK